MVSRNLLESYVSLAEARETGVWPATKHKRDLRSSGWGSKARVDDGREHCNDIAHNHMPHHSRLSTLEKPEASGQARVGWSPLARVEIGDVTSRNLLCQK